MIERERKRFLTLAKKNLEDTIHALKREIAFQEKLPASKRSLKETKRHQARLVTLKNTINELSK
jgi:hypothetical protein